MKHQEHIDNVRDAYLMIQTFKISVERDFTCPAKTIAIFAHDSEFSFDKEEMPSLVRRVSEECKTIQDVSALVKRGVLPEVVSG